VQVIAIPDGVNVLAQYPIAVVSSSQNAQLAQSWINYVTSPEGQAILLKYGFIIPPKNATTAATTSPVTATAASAAAM